MSLSLLLAQRFRKSQRHSGFMGFMARSSSLGIILGVAVLILALSVVNGFQQQLVERLLALVPHVEYVAADKPIAQWPQKQQRLQQQDNVKAAAPFIAVNAMAQYRGQLEAAQVRGVVPELETKVSIVDEFIRGKKLSQLTSNEVVMGAQLANALGLETGDNLTLLMTDISNHSDALSAPIRLNVQVVGLIHSQGPLDKVQIFLPLATLQQPFELEHDQVTGLRVTLDDVFSAPSEAMRIGRTLDNYVYVNSWVRTQGGLYQDIQMVRTIVYLSVFLIIAVASFNIISSLFMEVKEKQSAIAILRTMGAGDLVIMQAFMLQGVVSAVIATLIGALVGVLLALNITDIFVLWSDFIGENKLAGVYFIDFLPAQIHWQDITLVSAITLVITVLASIYPAWQAAKIDPAKVLGN
ncbi:lipoprotein-releasing ABC transporter permease subunit [Pseudoalteromonas sp. BDTF-M6]|uniref:lipoprotein-releasing ABC transporter permease subunit n=1 Tax=Pseudoalteromonas sp. BDTF-M6 TaxID=2796132 RepID=UPI001BAE966C|nr:lipoprotein-releasing ABC transporter permease subunit [Pseudoalteromonas sp. BDTF-M6]MBS3796618.1 lipoprotein-releasing ABC transporter permease subunit [Pseudoalteromonas sp. BDTF-M6]